MQPDCSVHDAVPRDPAADVWDVVVIGSGAGGGTAGFEIARQGRSVLFLERGRLLGQDPSVMRGGGAGPPGENAELSPGENAELSMRRGLWPETLYERVGAREHARTAPIGCGTGGSTARFAAVMDRLRRPDFTPARYFQAADAMIAESWPITYEELEPFYREAEQLYRVRGTLDPLAPYAAPLLPPPPSSELEICLLENLRAAGLSPYRIHYARERLPGCAGCLNALCPRPCRNDAGRICVEPALREHGAHILPECQVLRLETRARVVREAICRWNGRQVAVRGRTFVLAANAFFTPALLQCSANDSFPDGLANSSGLVGRNLMFHASDLALGRLRAPAPGLLGWLGHGISLNDYYTRGGAKLGNIHVHATYEPPEGKHRPAAKAAMLFATVVEDVPYPSNRVSVRAGHANSVVWQYSAPADLRVRSAALLQGFAATVRSHLDLVPLESSFGMPNVTHVCGTCRFGDDPRTSVLDRHNRAHDLDNLYVVDASFFPSSGGMQPSLTVVANSLRVGREIARRL